MANATVIGALQPLLMLMIAGPLFGERPRWTDGAWGLLAISGAAMVVLGGDAGGANSLGGDLLAACALIAWTAYFVASKTALHPAHELRVPHRHLDRLRDLRHPDALPPRAAAGLAHW